MRLASTFLLVTAGCFILAPVEAHLVKRQVCAGCPTDEKPANEEVQQHVDAVKESVEGHLNKQFDVFEAVSYKTQVVAGTNWFVKVHGGDDEYLHLRIYETLPYAGSELHLHGVQEGKTLEDPLEYFEAHIGEK